MSDIATNQEKRDKLYEYWRWRILLGTMIGYIFFYFVRKSITMAMPGLEEIGVTKTTLGLFLTVHGVLYGVARFVNGVWSDRVNPRYFMSIGLFLAAMTNVFCGFSGDIATAMGFSDASRANVIAWIIGSFWIINGWVQGMGFPPCAKSLMHWFAPREHGVKFATWNISHSFGAGLLFILNSFVVALGWKYCFLVPAALSILGALGLVWALRDSPEKDKFGPERESFEPVEKYYARKHGLTEETPVAAAQVVEEEKTSWWSDLCAHVFSNWAIWVLCLANFFVYIVRFSILDWAPTFLSQAKHLDLQSAGWATACYEIFGACGIILSGVMMDKVFKGRGAKACFWYMVGCLVFSLLFWKLDSESLLLNILVMSVIGFFIYGPQCLIGCVASTIATKKAGAASSGLTGLFGYLATIVTGVGVGFIVDSATKPAKELRNEEVVSVINSTAEVTGVSFSYENIDTLTKSALEGTKVGYSETEVDEFVKAHYKGTIEKLVKSAESLYDSNEALKSFVDKAKSKGKDANLSEGKGEKLINKRDKAIAAMRDAIEALPGGKSLDPETSDKLKESIVATTIKGREEIVKAGWPRIFGMLVISSLAGIVLFALIFNAASPEVLREEKERKEREAAEKGISLKK